MRRLLASLLILAAGLGARPAAAAGFDEFQIFDGRIGEPGAVDFNLHYNLGRRGRLDSPREAGAPRNGMLLTPEIGFPTAPGTRSRSSCRSPANSPATSTAAASRSGTPSSAPAPPTGPSPMAWTSSCATSPPASPRPTGR
ncbi:hypothetical protein ACFQY5_06625 [Paeniroseomonas aquatica]|uniref:hypothetical protein n=1 Tax=Paeniroseomonas aquatica TaxID=373043 RepID=UPI0036189541